MTKTWLITGCSAGGIGEGIARAVLENGYNAVVTARSTGKVQGIVDDYPGVSPGCVTGTEALTHPVCQCLRPRDTLS